MQRARHPTWQGMSAEEYSAKKRRVAEQIIARLEKTLFPGLSDAIELMDPAFLHSHSLDFSTTITITCQLLPHYHIPIPIPSIPIPFHLYPIPSPSRPYPSFLPNPTPIWQVGTPRTHRRFLNRVDGTYGPIPARRPLGLLGMPFNTTQVPGLYCVGDSCFPGQGVIAVAFSGIMCAHRVAADLGYEKRNQALDTGLSKLLAWFRTLA
ncbi:unnamed protein product [Closterium sp. NIES-54]